MDRINGGYYIKARKIQESKIHRQPPYVREIWDWLLMNANHSDNKYNGHEIKRGQLFRAYKDIREGLAWYVGYRKEMYNENHTKKAMKALREAGMISTTKALGGVMITILNYSKYQNPKNYESTSDRTNDRTNVEPMLNQGGTDNNKNEKNVNNETKDIVPEELRLKFNDFIENRKTNKSPMTTHAIKLLIGKVEKFSRGNIKVAISILDEAIINNWKSVYEPKNTNQKGNFDFLKEEK